MSPYFKYIHYILILFILHYFCLTFLPILQQCLNQILCQGNNEMTMIPRGMRGESGLVLWSLKLHQSFHDQITNANKVYIEMEQNGKNVLVKSIFLEEDVVKLKYTVKELERERPKKESFCCYYRHTRCV